MCSLSYDGIDQNKLGIQLHFIYVHHFFTWSGDPESKTVLLYDILAVSLKTKPSCNSDTSRAKRSTSGLQMPEQGHVNDVYCGFLPLLLHIKWRET